MGDFDDFEELYADLEDREIDIVLPVGEEEGDENGLEEKGAGVASGAIESCSSTDSDDDLHIVLNEDEYCNKLPIQKITASRDCGEVEGDDLVVTGGDCYEKELKVTEVRQSVNGLLRVNRERGSSTKGAHRNSLISCSTGGLRSKNSLSGRGHWDHLTVPYSFGGASYNLGFSMAFPNGSIFDIDVESFECKPWRFNGVDITDFFNFGLDEEGWRTYCKQVQVRFQQINSPILQYSNLNKPTGTMSGEVAQGRRDVGPENPNYLLNEKKEIRMPKGRAIQVESGNGDRMPSIDVRRPRNQDSDVVIQIATVLAVEDALDPIKDRITHSVSHSEILSNFRNEFTERDSPSRKSLTKPDAVVADHYCSSSNSSDHNGSFEASRDDVFLEKVSSPECIHLNSDSQFQESVLSDCHLSDETGSDISKIDCTIYGADFPESLLGLNYSHQKTPHKIDKLNLTSDDGVVSPPLHGQMEDGELQREESDTVLRKWDGWPNERGHSIRGKISARNNIKENKGKTLKTAPFLTCSRGHYEDRSLVINMEKRSTSRECNTRRNDFYVNRRSHHKSKIPNDIVSRSHLQSNSQNMPLYDRRGCRTSRRVDGHDMMMQAHYPTMEAKSSRWEKSLNACRERSLDDYGERSLNEYRERSSDDYRDRTSDEYFEMGIPYVYEEEEHCRNKCNRVPCSSGALRRFHELHSYGKNQLVEFELSSKYADNQEDSRLYEGELHPRIFRDVYDADGKDWHYDDSHRNQLPRLFKPYKRYMSYSGFSHSQETFSSMSNKHFLVPSKKCHKSSSRTGFNFGRDQSAEGKTTYPDNSAYNDRRKGSLPLPEILAEVVSFRHHDTNNLSSPKRHTLYGTVHHQNGQTHKNSVSGQKVSRNHLRIRSGNEFNVKSSKDFDSTVRISLSDDFVKTRHELDVRCCREAVSKNLNGSKVKSKGRCTTSGRRSQIDNDLPALKQSRASSNHKIMTQNHVYPEKEVEELEEGQLVEESDSYEMAEVKFISDGKITASTAKTKLVGGYDRNHLLETLAKMEKRGERFKDPIPPKKEPENCGDVQPDAANKDQVKQQRPPRKRRWCGS